MESGVPVESYNEGELEWRDGLGILSSALEQSFSDSEQSAEQSAEQSQAESFSPEYDMGAFQAYTIQDFGVVYAGGMCAGFAVAICVAFAAWAVACAISILKKGGNA